MIVYYIGDKPRSKFEHDKPYTVYNVYKYNVNLEYNDDYMILGFSGRHDMNLFVTIEQYRENQIDKILI